MRSFDSKECVETTLFALYNHAVIRHIFHVDLDAFFVSVEQIHDPSLRGRPVIVGGHPGSRGVVSAASYEARQYGVHSAMPLVQAQRLCPQAVFVPVHYGRYVDASRQFMALLETISPVLEPLGLDEAFLEVTSIVADSGETRSLAAMLKRRVTEELGLCCSVGVASCKTVAKVASDFDKPDGLVVVPVGEEAAFLAPLHVRTLPGVGKKTEECLGELGVQTIGQLAALPDNIVRRKLGRFGVVLLQHARGIDISRVEPRGEPRSMSRETTFQVDTRDLTTLHSALRTMSEELEHEFRTHRKRAGTVTLKLRFEDFQTITRQMTLKSHSCHASGFFHAAKDLLQDLIGSDERRIRLIGVRASRLTGPEHQLDMFASDAARLQHLERAITEIHDRYGPDAIRPLRRT